MGYSIYSLKGHHGGSEAEEFFEAAEKARRAVEKMHDLASEMEDRYSERYYGMRGYGRRGGYGEREDWDDMDEMYGMRRRRDSRGRYM